MAHKKANSSSRPAPITGQDFPENWHERSVLHPGDAGYAGVSEVFNRFAAPLLVGAAGMKEIEVRYTLAMIGWNLAVLPPHLRPRLLATALQNMPAESHAQARRDLLALVARKEQHFAQYTWQVQRFHIDMMDDGTLLVAVAVTEM